MAILKSSTEEPLLTAAQQRLCRTASRIDQLLSVLKIIDTAQAFLNAEASQPIALKQALSHTRDQTYQEVAAEILRNSPKKKSPNGEALKPEVKVLP